MTTERSLSARALTNDTHTLVLGVGVVVLAAHVIVALSHGGPVAVPDIPGYLSVAQWVAGGQPPPPLGYHPGYGLLLAPVALAGASPDTLHTAALVFNGLLAAGSVLLAGALARTLAPTAPWWVPLAAGFTAALHPSLSSASRVAWPEFLLVTLVLATAVVLARAASAAQASPAQFGLVGALAVIGVSAHPRMAALSVAAGLAVLVLRPGWRALGGFAAGAAVAAVLVVVSLAVAYNGPATGGRLTGAVESAGEGAGLLTTTAGQLAAIAAGTAGLAMVGLVEAARRATLAVRRRTDEHPERARAAVAVLLLAGAVGTLLISGASLAGSDRSDTFAYGRYLDPYTVALVVLALATFALRHREVVASSLMIVGTATAIVWMSADLAVRPGMRIMVLATDQWWLLSDGRLVPALLAGSAVAAVGLTALLAAEYRPQLVAAPIVLALAVAGWATITGHRHLAGVGEVSAAQASVAPQVPAVIEAASSGGGTPCLAHEQAGVPSYVLWLYRMALPDLVHERFDLGEGEQPCSNAVIAHTTEGPVAACAAARLVASEPAGTWSLWDVPLGACV